MSNALSMFMRDVSKHTIMSNELEIQQFNDLDELTKQLTNELNNTAILYNKIPDIIVMLADGYEAVKHIVKPHKHDLKTKQLTEYVITSFTRYQTLYQQKVITKDISFKSDLDTLTTSLSLDSLYILELANEIRNYNGTDILVDLHVLPDNLTEIQYNITVITNKIKKLKNDIVSCNLRLVVNIAKKYHAQVSHMQFEDLIQEGNIGLMTAVDRYDVSFGNKFSTVATWWIKQSIIRALQNTARTIRLPVSVQDHISKALKVYDELQSEYKRTPTDIEMGAALGITVERYKELQNSNINITSIDTPIGNDEDSNITLADVIADVAQSVDMDIYSDEIQQLVKSAIARLSDIEKSVIEMRYGFYTDTSLTLGECAAALGITKMVVYTNENKALLKLHRYLCNKFSDQ